MQRPSVFFVACRKACRFNGVLIMSGSKAIILAPYWRLRGYVGNYRVDRFIRWLSERGDEVVVVCGGENDEIAITPWGTEIAVRDLLGVFSERMFSGARRPNLLRHVLSNLMFNPDPIIVWGRRVVTHPSVLRYAQGARWVISTSPPESPHVAAAQLARRVGAAHVVDMRDGWLDEPIKPLLQNSRLRRWREGRLESRVLRHASCIFVTSNEWQEMLQTRLPFVHGKTVVLTNAYPQAEIKPSEPTVADGPLRLLYTGLLRGSTASRQADLLLCPLLAGLGSNANKSGILVFLGNLRREDRDDLARYEERFKKCGWRIETHAAVSRAEMLERLAVAHGLLLLSASHAAIPSKTFEYIPMAKPVLAACPEGSSVWRMVADLPQFFPMDYRNTEQASNAVRAFLNACRAGITRFEVPEQYSEQYLKKVFWEPVSS